MMMNGIGMMIWGLISLLLGLLLLFLFVVAAAYGVKWVWRQSSDLRFGRGDSALDILKKRYARGEIGKEEFDRIEREIE